MGFDSVESSIGMIRESARGLVGRDALCRARALRFARPGFDRAVWREMCAMGWPALRLAEEEGGVGLGLLAYCALAEELGRGLVPEPLIPAVLAAALVDGPAREKHLSGERLILPAWQDSRDALGPEAPLSIRDGTLSGSKLCVPMALGADDFLVIGTAEAALVAADAPGVTVTALETQDGGHFATVEFDSVPATLLPAAPGPVLAEAALATGAYMLGQMEAALEMTVSYLKTRVQFDKTIGSFQILQHMAVDMGLEVELTRASIEAAAQQWDRDGPGPESHAAISRAKARASQSAPKVMRDAIQLHGGIGFTDEHDIGLFLRKAMVCAPQFGTARRHSANFCALRPVEKTA